MFTAMPRIAIAVSDFADIVATFREVFGMPVLDISDSSVESLDESTEVLPGSEAAAKEGAKEGEPKKIRKKRSVKNLGDKSPAQKEAAGPMLGIAQIGKQGSAFMKGVLDPLDPRRAAN